MIDAGTVGTTSVVVTREELDAMPWEEARALERELRRQMHDPTPGALLVSAWWPAGSSIGRMFPDGYRVAARGRGVPCITTLPPDPRAGREHVRTRT